MVIISKLQQNGCKKTMRSFSETYTVCNFFTCVAHHIYIRFENIFEHRVPTCSLCFYKPTHIHVLVTVDCSIGCFKSRFHFRHAFSSLCKQVGPYLFRSLKEVTASNFFGESNQNPPLSTKVE